VRLFVLLSATLWLPFFSKIIQPGKQEPFPPPEPKTKNQKQKTKNKKLEIHV
jgi:hypothetical protein